MKALQISKHGVPAEVVELVDIPEPVTPKLYSPLFMGSAKIVDGIKLGAQLVAEGKLSIPIAATYPLSSAPAALAHAQKGGKVLFAVDERSGVHG